MVVPWQQSAVTTARSLDWLTLAAAEVDEMAAFYRDTLELSPLADTTQRKSPPCAHAFEVPPGSLCLRDLTSMPSGGVHTHFAIAVTPERYERLYDTLTVEGSVTERTFSGRRSLYGFDPAGHCFEFGENPELSHSVGHIFEVVLEVADLERAIKRYAQLGFEPMVDDQSRRRRRLRGPFDLELWEPHLGIAEARGGCHVELGLTVTDAEAAGDLLAPPGRSPEARDDRLFVRDGDGHTWWLGEAD